MPKIYRIHLSKQNITLTHHNQHSLLTTLEQNGITPEYQCRHGYCGACRTKMTKGKVSYQETPLAFVNQDEILLCCCQVEQDLTLDI